MPTVFRKLVMFENPLPLYPCKQRGSVFSFQLLILLRCPYEILRHCLWEALSVSQVRIISSRRRPSTAAIEHMAARLGQVPRIPVLQLSVLTSRHKRQIGGSRSHIYNQILSAFRFSDSQFFNILLFGFRMQFTAAKAHPYRIHGGNRLFFAALMTSSCVPDSTGRGSLQWFQSPLRPQGENSLFRIGLI